ncbi:hypothetical protein [Nostoc sp.]|uniref:hypothetical protein n=1 Tax=Nostoc sp. TaxID=1180 RepID=UPI002FFBEEEF
MTDKELASLFNTSSEITGISDLGNAENTLINLLDNQHLERNEQKPKLPNNSNHKILNNPKPQINEISVNTPEITDVSPLEQCVIASDDWKPDLTGWEVSIGLPK